MTVTLERPAPHPPQAAKNKVEGRRRLSPPTTITHYAIWALTLLVVVGPIVPVLIASLWSTPLYVHSGHLTLTNYHHLLSDTHWWHAVLNSVLFASMNTVASVLLGGAAAVLLTRTNLPGRRALTATLLVPVLLPGIVLIVGWAEMWAPSGYAASWLQVHTVLSFPVNLFSLPGMAMVGMTVAAPVVFLFCRSTLLSIDPSLEDAARSLGARPLRALFSVSLPMLRPALINSALLVFALSLEVLGLPLILGYSSNITLMSTYLYNNWVNVVPSQQGLVSAGAMFLLAGVSGLLLLRNRLVGDLARFTTTTGKPTSQRVIRIGAIRWPLSLGIAAVLAVFVVIPLIGILLTSFTTILTPFLSPWTRLTTVNFHTIFNNSFYRQSIIDSLLIASVGGVLSTIAIAAVAVIAHRSGFRFAGSLQQAMMWPRMMPGLVTGMAFFWCFAILDPGGAVRGSLWGLGLAFAVRSLALGYSAFYPALAGIGRDLDRAARTSGATWWQAMRTVVLRLILPAMAVSFILLFVAMLNEADPAVFLVTNKTPVTGLTMLQLASTGTGGTVAALGVIQMLITLVALSLGRVFLGLRARA